MVCEFPEYTVTQWNTKPKLGGRRWVEGVKELESIIIKSGFGVGVIVGDPGMGKTALLLSLKDRLANSGFHVVFMDLAGKDNLVEEFWKNINMDRLREEAYGFLYKNRKNIGYRGSAKLFKEFNAWLKIRCKKRDYNDDYAHVFKIYCNSYSDSIDDMISLIDDISRLGKSVVLLIDETRNVEGIIKPLHRLLNSNLNFKLVLTIIPDVLESITDGAIRRRLESDALRINLSPPINDDEVRGILSAYCEEYADVLANAVKGSKTVNEILINARERYEEALHNCVGSSSECIKGFLSGLPSIESPQEVSKKLEGIIRDGINSLREQFGIEYVHDKGKKMVNPDNQTVIPDFSMYLSFSSLFNTLYAVDLLKFILLVNRSCISLLLKGLFTKALSKSRSLSSKSIPLKIDISISNLSPFSS